MNASYTPLSAAAREAVEPIAELLERATAALRVEPPFDSSLKERDVFIAVARDVTTGRVAVLVSTPYRISHGDLFRVAHELITAGLNVAAPDRAPS